jgi:hemolysin III
MCLLRSRGTTENLPILIEELANAVTHGIGAVLSTGGLVLLIVLAVEVGDFSSLVAATVYGASLVLVFLASAVYHGLRHGKAKRVFLLLDHCAIFLLIAGTYTPIALLALPADPGRPLLVAIWGLAVLGVILKVAAFRTAGLDRWNGVSAVLYLAMGWFGLLWAGGSLLESLHPSAFGWLLAGGIVYSIGVLFYFWERLPFGHAVWHLFVLIASACHFAAVFYYVLPPGA